MNNLGYWIGHNETYNGTLYSIREEHLFDPQERVRVQVAFSVLFITRESQGSGSIFSPIYHKRESAFR